GGYLAYWISSQLQPLLTAGFVGVAATGGLRAAQTLVAPTHVLLRTVEAIAPSRASKSFQVGGSDDLRVYIRRIGLPSLGLLLSYLVPISFLSGPIIQMLVGPEYRPYSWLVV